MAPDPRQLVASLGDAVAALAHPGSLGRLLDFGQLAALERGLSAATDARLRRVGLAVLTGLAAGPGGWDPERRALLRAYGEDPSPLVAGPAQFTFPPDEGPSA